MFQVNAISLKFNLFAVILWLNPSQILVPPSSCSSCSALFSLAVVLKLVVTRGPLLVVHRELAGHMMMAPPLCFFLLNRIKR